MSKPFTSEQNEWLAQNFDCSYRKLTEKFNDKFGTDYTWTRDGYNPVERRCKRMGLSRYKTNYGFTPEEDKWLKQYARQYSSNWLSQNIEMVFGTKHSPDAIKTHVREQIGITKGNGGIREDTVQTYKKPIGSICSWGKHTTRIKLYDTGDDKVDWYPYGRFLYEQAHGIKLPNTYQVVHVDGDNINFDINNLCAVSHSEHAVLTANDWHGKGEVTKTAISYARLKRLLKEQGTIN